MTTSSGQYSPANKSTKSIHSTRKATPIREKTLPPEPAPDKSLISKLYLNYVIPIIFILIAICALYPPKTNDMALKYCSLDLLKSEFPKQNDMFWRQLRYGIEYVLNHKPTKPSVTLIAYRDSNCEREFKERIINITSTCLNTSNPVKLDPEKLSTSEIINDYGVVLSTYKEPLLESGILLISDVNKVNITHFFFLLK